MNWLREPDTEPIPGYRLVGPLGSGGFGEVWKCLAPGDIHKAIKFVYGNLNALDGDAAKAQQEKNAIQRVKEVRHPFLLSTERIDEVDGELLIVMELADKSLYDVLQECQQEGRPGIPREALLGFMADAAEGLDHLIERHALQHLDVKPKNLFLIADRVKVADFGLVKHLERQSASGIMGGITPVYAAPETFANKISKHSDQYSLAVVYVELLTGRRPFGGKNIRQLALQHMSEAPDLDGLPEADRAVVAKALAKNPDERFPNCAAFVRALGAQSLRADVTAAAGSSQIEPPSPQRRRTATMPDVAVGNTTHPTAPTRPRGTPQPASSRTLSRFPTLPAPDHPVSASVSFRPEEGVLRPAILIGIGSFGRKALQQVRCRLLDRVGELAAVPCWRFIYLDVEPDSPGRATSSADAGLLHEHTFHAPLQAPTGYRRRQLDQLLEWLPREKLYSIPRSLRVDSNRALGRLAFCDHYLRFAQRLKTELQTCTHPEAVTQGSDHTGLPVRTKVPAVYVFASAAGGTSGMLLDAGHAVRRALEKFNIPDAPVTAFVFAGSPDDPSTPPAEQANVFATLTELNHYADPDVSFAAQYGGPEGPAVGGNGPPFTATYLLPMAERTIEAFRDCVSHLAAYVTHDLTTPLGVGLEKLRRRPAPAGRTPFRGFGTFGVWYPRGLLLRSAARQLCVKLMRGWSAPLHGQPPADAEQVLHLVLADNRLTPGDVQQYIAAESATSAEGNPVDRLRGWAAGLTAQADAATRRADPSGWAIQLWDQARDVVGMEPTVETDSTFRRGRLSKSLDGGVRRALEAWQNELTELLRPLDELAGARLAAAEAVVAQLAQACSTAALGMDKALAALSEPRAKARAEVQAALDSCAGAEPGAGFSLFGKRAARATRGLADKVRAFVEVRVSEDLALSASQFYRRLQAWFDERARDLRFARERVDQLARTLQAQLMLPGTDPTPPPGVSSPRPDPVDEAMQNTLRGSNTIRVVLPYGTTHLDASAAEMLTLLPPEEAARLELVLTRLVVDPRGGLTGACRASADLFRQLAAPMIEQATAFLSNLLPTEDVTAVELTTAGDNPGELARRVQSYVRAAAPLAGGPAEEERTFVLVPDTDAGAEYSAEVKRSVPTATAVPVRGPGADLMFCREQGCLRTVDLFRLLEPCWEAYHQATTNLETNPHARFDVSGWLPLVE
ncbi:MAG: tubulin-like doman-containing protein [Gemmataceae bacterium]